MPKATEAGAIPRTETAAPRFPPFIARIYRFIEKPTLLRSMNAKESPFC